MHSQLIRAYLWQAVIRLGFSPSGMKERKSWLHQYGKSIKDFWEIASYPKHPIEEGRSLRGALDCAELLAIEYAVHTEEDKFVVRFLYSPPLSHRELMWIHDVDSTFFCFPPEPFLAHHNQEKSALRESTRADMEAVIDGLLVHPAAHQHVESPIDNHDIRLGGGIRNPYLYLFHLRYQLCPIPEKKAAERERLIGLFADAVKSNSLISAGNLMAQP